MLIMRSEKISSLVLHAVSCFMQILLPYPRYDVPLAFSELCSVAAVLFFDKWIRSLSSQLLYMRLAIACVMYAANRNHSTRAGFIAKSHLPPL